MADDARITGVLDRFQAIHRALIAAEPGGADARWLAVAAPLLAAAHGSPAAVAGRLAEAAQVWQRHPPGFGWGHAPVRFLVAAVDVVLDEASEVVVAQLAGMRPRLRAAHAPHVGIFEFLALLLLRLAHADTPTAEAAVPRAVALASALHHRHALLEGDTALGWGALLVDVPGDPAAIAGVVDARFQELRALPGVHRSDALVAAHLLTLASAQATTAVGAAACLAQARLIPAALLVGRTTLTLLPAPMAEVDGILSAVQGFMQARGPAPLPGSEVAATLAAVVVTEQLDEAVRARALRRWLRAAVILAGMEGTSVTADSR